MAVEEFIKLHEEKIEEEGFENAVNTALYVLAMTIEDLQAEVKALRK